MFCQYIEFWSGFPIIFSLFLLGFYVPLENTFDNEGLFILIYIRHSMSISSNIGTCNMPHLLWHETSVYNGNSRGPMKTHIGCQALGDGDITTCLKDCLSGGGGGVEPRSTECKANAQPLSHRGGCIYLKTSYIANSTLNNTKLN